MTSVCSDPKCKQHLHDTLRFFCTQILGILDGLEKVNEKPSLPSPQKPQAETLTEEEIALLEEAEAAEATALEDQQEQEEEQDNSPRRKRRPSKVEHGLSQTPTKRSSPDKELEEPEVDELLALMDEMIVH